jgi:hypothetical protein
VLNPEEEDDGMEERKDQMMQHDAGVPYLSVDELSSYQPA